MRRAVDRGLRLVEAVNRFTGNLSGLAILLTTFLVGYEVVMRFFFRKPTIWVHETSGYLLIFTVMMGIGYTLLQDRHVRMDLLYVRLPWRIRVGLDLVTYSVALVLFFSAFAWSGWTIFRQAVESDTRETFGVLRTPLAWTYWMLPAGGVLIGLQTLHRLYYRLRSLREGREIDLTAPRHEEEG